MEYYGKNKKVYKGIWISFLFLILVPFSVFFLFRYVFVRFYSYPEDITNSLSIGFAGTIGFLFSAFCLVNGFIQEMFLGLIQRIKDTISYFGFGGKGALSWYFSEFIRTGGPLMWLFFLIWAANIVVAVIGFSNFFSWYHAINN